MRKQLNPAYLFSHNNWNLNDISDNDDDDDNNNNNNNRGQLQL